jgi:glutamate synthase (ferredoxin)
MRMLGHNGEINTLLGNINWVRAREAKLGAKFSKSGPSINTAAYDPKVPLLQLIPQLVLLPRRHTSITLAHSTTVKARCCSCTLNSCCV